MGSTEEYNKRLQRAAQRGMSTSGRAPNPDAAEIDKLIATKHYLNAHTPGRADDPLELDHIRPVKQGGKFTRLNLRLLPRSKNRDKRHRGEREIRELTLLNAAQLGIPPEDVPLPVMYDVLCDIDLAKGLVNLAMQRILIERPSASGSYEMYDLAALILELNELQTELYKLGENIGYTGD